MSLVVVWEVPVQVVCHDQLHDRVAQELHPLIVTSDVQNTSLQTLPRQQGSTKENRPLIAYRKG